MTVNLIILIVFVSLVFLTTSLALGILISTKGDRHYWWDGLLYFFLPIISQFAIMIWIIKKQKIVSKKNIYKQNANDQKNNT